MNRAAENIFDLGKRSSGKISFQTIKDFVTLECEMQRQRLFLWSPVILSLGIGLYFYLPFEPPLFTGVFGFLIALCFSALTFKSPVWRLSGFFLMLVALGFFLSIIRTETVNHALLDKKVGPVSITGEISNIEFLENESDAKITLTALEFEEGRSHEMPEHIRIRIREAADLNIGNRIQILAQLHPPSSPVIPGGFDFRQYLYFQKIGAVGFAYYSAEIIDEKRTGIWEVNALRASVIEKIRKALPEKSFGIAAALITGQKSGISEADAKAMRESGLAHMLAISGLHIGLFSGFVFLVLRSCLAAVPGAAIRYPIKKYAAVGAFFAACFYLTLSGFSISAQRALIMAGVVFLAIIMDRTALSLRLIAFAALAVLVVAPESLLSAGFQMSFAAVTSLIVFYDLLRPWWWAQHRNASFLRKLALYFLGVCCTSIIATLSTAPIALYHFQQTASYGLLANMFAIPILSFLIMPMAVISLFLMPFNLEYLPLLIMGRGIEWILDIAYWVSVLPYAKIQLAMIPHIALVLFVLGVLILMLWRGRMKYAGLVLVASAIFFVHQSKMPDILVSGSGGDLVGIYDEGQGLFLSTLRAERFVRDNWVSSYGLQEDSAKSWPREGQSEGGIVFCGEEGCRSNLKDYNISFLTNPETLETACVWADLIIAEFPVPDFKCSKPAIDVSDTYRNGAFAVWLSPENIEIRNAAEMVGKRPWSPK